jgi:MoxR-like ATPase
MAYPEEQTEEIPSVRHNPRVALPERQVEEILSSWHTLKLRLKKYVRTDNWTDE